MFVIDVILWTRNEYECQRLIFERDTYVNRHLINMDPLLNAKFRDEHIESSIKDAHNNSWANDRPVALCEIGDKDAEIQVR